MATGYGPMGMRFLERNLKIHQNFVVCTRIDWEVFILSTKRKKRKGKNEMIGRFSGTMIPKFNPKLEKQNIKKFSSSKIYC